MTAPPIKKVRGMTKKEQLRERWQTNPKFNRHKASREIPMDLRTIQRYIKEFELGVPADSQRGTGSEGIKKHFTTENGCIELNSYTICDKDDALRIAKIDLDRWKIEKYTFNSWQVSMKVRQITGEDTTETKTNYQHKFDLKLKIPHPLETAITELIKEIPAIASKKPPKYMAESGVAGEIALVDAHFGKFAWALETGRRDYDLKIASDDYYQACAKNLDWLKPFKPEKIFYVLGNDYMHTENYWGTTPRGGNVLDVDSRLPKIIKTAIAIQIACIKMCRDVAPTEVIWIPGNHDEHSSLWLACVVEQAFNNDEFVTVDISPEKRKARLWGSLLVGWAHDIHSKYPSWNNELAQEFPELWGQSTFREWHCGHKHKKMETKMHPVITQGGVLIRQLTALTPIDAWHYENMFTDAVPGGESLLWSKKNGVIANFTAWSDAPYRKRQSA